MPKKTERDALGFSNIILSQNSKKMKGDPLRKKLSRKVSQCRKQLKGGTLWCRPVLYVTRGTVSFSSLGQRVKFGVSLKFCRTFFGVELFWSLQVYQKNTDEKP